MRTVRTLLFNSRALQISERSSLSRRTCVLVSKAPNGKIASEASAEIVWVFKCR